MYFRSKTTWLANTVLASPETLLKSIHSFIQIVYRTIDLLIAWHQGYSETCLSEHPSEVGLILFQLLFSIKWRTESKETIRSHFSSSRKYGFWIRTRIDGLWNYQHSSFDENKTIRASRLPYTPSFYKTLNRAGHYMKWSLCCKGVTTSSTNMLYWFSLFIYNNSNYVLFFLCCIFTSLVTAPLWTSISISVFLSVFLSLSLDACPVPTQVDLRQVRHNTYTWLTSNR